MKKFICLLVSLFVGFSCFAETITGEVEGIKYFVNDERKYNEAIYTGCDTKILELIAEEIKEDFKKYECGIYDGYGLYFSNSDIILYYMKESDLYYYEKQNGIVFTTTKQLGEYSFVIVNTYPCMYYFLQIDKNIWLYVVAD